MLGCLIIKINTCRSTGFSFREGNHKQRFVLPAVESSSIVVGINSDVLHCSTYGPFYSLFVYEIKYSVCFYIIPTMNQIHQNYLHGLING